MKNDLNVYGVFIGDVFQLHYYGINVFFLVCQTEVEKVYIAELKTKTIKIDGEKVDMLTKRMRYADKPYIVKENNNMTYTRYAVTPVEINNNVYLPIEIDFDSDLYKEAIKLNDYVIWGTAYAYKVEDYYNVGFERKNEKEYLA